MDLYKKIAIFFCYNFLAIFIVFSAHAADKPIVFAGDVNYPPFQSLQDNQPIGINIDILRALSKSMNRDFDIRLMKWSEAQEMLKYGKVHALTEMAYSESRAHFFDFSDQTLLYKYSFFVRHDDENIHQLSEATGKTIAVTKGGYPFQLMAPNSNITLLIVDSYLEGFQQLLGGGVDAVAADSWVGAYLLEEHNLIDQIKYDNRSFAEQPGFIAVKKGNTELLTEINRGITKLKEEGEIQKIFDKWSGDSFVFMTKEKLIRLVSIIIFMVVMCIFVGAFVWVYVLKKQIYLKTKALQHAHNDLEAKVRDRTFRLELETADHKQSLEELRGSEERFRCVFGQAAVGVARVSLDGAWLDINEKLCQIVGYSAEEMKVLTFQDITHPDDLKIDIKYVNLLLNNEIGTYSMEKRYFKKDGNTIWVNLTVSLTKDRDDKPDYFIAIIEDITKRKLAEDSLKYKAFHDGLTGLNNRDWLTSFLTYSLADRPDGSRASFTLLYLDLDNFKNVNDSLGHTAGDELLIETADRLKACLATSDILTRLGGDEFVVILEDMSNRSVIEVADRIIESIAQPYFITGHEVRTGVSIGIMMNSSGYLSPAEILRDSDVAMYQAKHKGKNCYVIYDTAMREDIVQHLAIEQGINNAINEDQFFLVYQPIISIASGKIEGCEALIRWNHKELGAVGPDKFIPIAESSRLIYPLGKWIINEGLRQWSEWKKKFSGFDVMQLSINLSSSQFHDDEMINALPELFYKYDLQGSDIAFEITETAIIQDTELAQNVIKKLKHLGCDIHLDDFGTGYSSLSHLSEFPIDVIKIDRSFVEKLTVNAKHQKMVNGVISLAHTLGIKCTAEGIESEEQGLMLKDKSCNYGQGYYFSRPLTKDAMERAFSDHFRHLNVH